MRVWIWKIILKNVENAQNPTQLRLRCQFDKPFFANFLEFLKFFFSFKHFYLKQITTKILKLHTKI